MEDLISYDLAYKGGDLAYKGGALAYNSILIYLFAMRRIPQMMRMMMMKMDDDDDDWMMTGW